MTQQAPNMPFSDEAERGVLSGVVLDPVNRLDALADKLQDGAFYYPANAAFYDVLTDMRKSGRPIDSITVTSRARDLAKLDTIGGESAVFEIYAFRPAALHFEAYVRILMEKRALRELLKVCDDMRSKAAEPGADVVGLIDEFQKEALTISLERDERGPVHVSVVCDEIAAQTRAAIERLAQGIQIQGMETGFPTLDHITQGLTYDDRAVVVALSSTGKTVFLTNMVTALAEQGEGGLIFMLDGTAASTIVRAIADRADVTVNAIKTGLGLMELDKAKQRRLDAAHAWLKEKNIHIDDRAGLSIQQILSTTRRYKKLHGIKWWAIDFFGNITCPGFKPGDRVAELTMISRLWKNGVIDMGIPSIMLAQANAELRVGHRASAGPHVIKDCKALYEDATKVTALSREERTLDELREKEVFIPDTDRQRAPPLAEGEQFIVADVIKNKDGRLGPVWLRLNGPVMRFNSFVPGARINDSSVNKAARMRGKEQS